MGWSPTKLGFGENLSQLAEVTKIIGNEGREELPHCIKEGNGLVSLGLVVRGFTWFTEYNCDGFLPFGRVSFQFKDSSKDEIKVSGDYINTFLQDDVRDAVGAWGLVGR